MKKNNAFSIMPFIMVALMLIFFGLTWTMNLSHIPGLHADEAWSGIEAIKGNDISKVSGMTYYTGLLLPKIAQLCFTYFGQSVFTLRIIGVVANLIGLGLLLYMISRKRTTVALLFFLMFAQSILYQASVRVAWEVNAFTLLFVTVSAILFHKLWKDVQLNSPGTVLAFFCINILGAYNHILFASLSLATFFTLYIWIYYHQVYERKFYAVLTFINLLNVSILFLIMRFSQTYQWSIGVSLMLILSLFLVMIFEALILTKRPNINIMVPQSNLIKQLFMICLTLFIVGFILIHGVAFFEVIAGEKILRQNYGLELTISIKIILYLLASVFVIYYVVLLAIDFSNRKNSIFTIFFCSYAGSLCIFTTGNSYRYYLIMIFCVYFYMAFRIPVARAVTPLLTSIICSFLIISSILIYVHFEPRQIKHLNFTLGNGQSETSKHFLRKDSLMSSLKKLGAGQLRILDGNPYFISHPIKFYMLSSSWNSIDSIHVTIDYNGDSIDGFNVNSDF